MSAEISAAAAVATSSAWVSGFSGASDHRLRRGAPDAVEQAADGDGDGQDDRAGDQPFPVLRDPRPEALAQHRGVEIHGRVLRINECIADRAEIANAVCAVEAGATRSRIRGARPPRGLRRGLAAPPEVGARRGPTFAALRKDTEFGRERQVFRPVPDRWRMADPRAPAARPLSPHLQIYRWSWTMAMSIAHRATGARSMPARC